MNGRDNIQSDFLSVARQSVPQELRQGDKVCLLFTHQGNLVFIVRHHKDDSVSIEAAGGKIDPKPTGQAETPEEALEREAEQELGVKIRPIQRLCVDLHPKTQKPVGYYSCEVVDGYPYNAADKEHLGIIKVPIHQVENYQCLENVALGAAQEITDLTIPHIQLSRPIEFRVPEKAIMNFIQQLQDEPGAAFYTQEPSAP